MTHAQSKILAEVFALVSKQTPWRALLALQAAEVSSMHQINAKAALLVKVLGHKMLVKQPDVYAKDKLAAGCCLLKAFFGLNQARQTPRAVARSPHTGFALC